MLDAYAFAAILHAEASWEGRPTRANRAHDELVRIHHALRDRGPQTAALLLPQLRHEHPSVRCWAALHTLEPAPDAALPVLEEISRQDDLVRFAAQMLLAQWRDGTLQVP